MSYHCFCGFCTLVVPSAIQGIVMKSVLVPFVRNLLWLPIPEPVQIIVELPCVIHMCSAGVDDLTFIILGDHMPVFTMYWRMAQLAVCWSVCVCFVAIQKNSGYHEIQLSFNSCLLKDSEFGSVLKGFLRKWCDVL